MKKLLLLGVLALTAVTAFAIRNNVVIAPLQAVTATGGLQDLSVNPYTRTGTVSVLIKNEAGTNPTLDVKLQSSGAVTAGQSYTTAGTTAHELREGATTKVKLAATFTQSGARSIKYADLFLKKAGAFAAGKLLTLQITPDAASPGTPHASTVTGTANTVSIDNEVSTDYAWVRFTFATPVDLSDATVYWLVLTGDYTASATINVMWRAATVASGGNQATHDNSSWTAVTTESHEFMLHQQQFTDITGGAFTQVTTAASHQTVSFTLDGTTFSGFVRPYATIGGTSSPKFYVTALLNAEAR